MSDIDNLMTVKAVSTSLGNLAAEMNNTYKCTYMGKYLPFSYNKVINQKNYSENRLTIYSRDQKKAIRESYIDPDRSKTYAIMPESRDFFSAFYYIRHNHKDRETIYLDANGLIWKAKYWKVKKEYIETRWGRKRAQIISVSFEKISEEDKQRSDMLTNNLVNEDNTLSIWISDDEARLPYKAVYKMKPFSVHWVLESYE
jgi:hypothetical protein